MARPSWSGSISLAGFPVSVQAFNLVTKPQGFKTLDPVHKLPVKQQLVDINGEVVKNSETVRGVEVYDGICPVPEDALEALRSGERTTQVTSGKFPKRETVPLALATAHYVLGPRGDDAADSLNVLWNGLRVSGRVLVDEVVFRAGARPTLCAIDATEDGLMMHALPYHAQLRPDVVEWRPESNEQAAELFAAFMQHSGDTEDFEYAAVVDHYDEQLQAVIDAALSGEKVAIRGDKPPANAAPDLMAALEAEMKKAPAKKPAAKKTTRKKVAA